MANSVITYPEMFSLSSGKTMTDNSPASIIQSLSLLFQSSKYELFRDPRYGTDLMSIITDFNAEIIDTDIKSTIIEAMSIYKSDISVDESSISIAHTDEYTTIEFQYVVLKSNTLGKFEFKFNRKETT